MMSFYATLDSSAGEKLSIFGSSTWNATLNNHKVQEKSHEDQGVSNSLDRPNFYAQHSSQESNMCKAQGKYL